MRRTNISPMKTALIIFAMWILTAMTTTARADDWSAFKLGHVQSDGAIVDQTNGMTHSEGQSYAMLLATAAGDQIAFDSAWSFAKAKLRRSDGLFSWKFENGKVADDNNASDAEIVMAWALLRADRKWGGEYLGEALQLIHLIRSNLIVTRKDPAQPDNSLFLILPGIHGFEDKDGALKLNPSYWVFPAFSEFATADDPIFWQQVTRSGLRLIELSAKSGLTPDWIAFPSLTAAQGLSSKASYDALRAPLWMIWAGHSSTTFSAWRQLWRDRKLAWFDPSTGEQAAYAPGIEQLAVLALLDRAANAPEGKLAALPVIGRSTQYYAAAIYLLVRTAWAERFGE